MHWQGCLILAAAATTGAVAVGQEHVAVRARVFDIAYEVRDDALPLTSVVLWYTLDRGDTWQDYSPDDDRQSPITFHAPTEGLFGFFLVLTNTTGASSQPPTPSTSPQLWAFIDDTPPVVQLHPIRPSTALGRRVLQIRWTAIDAHLLPRPVEISYRSLPDDTWNPVTPNPLANTGRFDWRSPENLVGSVSVRVTVQDQGGHRVHSESQIVEIPPVTAELASLTRSNLGAKAGLPLGIGTSALTGSKRANDLADRLFAEAQRHGDRGEYRNAIAQLREAVRLNPKMTEAFARMGGMLYRLGDLDRALTSYNIALQQQPNLRSALGGSARVYMQKKDYVMASDRLRAALRYDPKDARMWMHLGDVAVYQGDEMLAHECYTRATQMDPEALEVIEEARKRLAVMAEVSRTYRRGSRPQTAAP